MSKVQEPSSPEQAFKFIGTEIAKKGLANRKDEGEIDGYENYNYNRTADGESIELTNTGVYFAVVDGFLTPIARDVFKRTGNMDEADKADCLTYLLGERLYGQLALEGKNCGLDDPCLLARQLIAREGASNSTADGMEKVAHEFKLPKRGKEDDDVNAADNQDIREYLGDSALGTIRALARQVQTTNIAALRIVMANALMPKKETKLTPRLKRKRDHEKHKQAQEAQSA